MFFTFLIGWENFKIKIMFLGPVSKSIIRTLFTILPVDAFVLVTK